MVSGERSEGQIYQHTHELLRSHETLLRDRRRNVPFLRALKQFVRNDSCVLDLGSGTGLWALVAARLGARRVVAIEQDQLLVGVIKMLAQANGVADRIEVLAGDSRTTPLNREFDLVVTETIGHLGFDENILSIARDARKRFLKPNGTLIPHSVSLMAAGARRPGHSRKLPVGVSADYSSFEKLCLHAPVAVRPARAIRLVTPPRVLVTVDLTSDAVAPDLTNLTAQWALQPADAIEGVVVWVDVTVAPGIRISTRQTTSWAVTFYRIEPFQVASGNLEFQLTLTQDTNRWQVSLQQAGATELQVYSPATAAAELVARSRGLGGILSHHQRLGMLPS